MRLGDYIILGNLALNMVALVCYAAQGHWKMAGYWLCVAGLNLSMIGMR